MTPNAQSLAQLLAAGRLPLNEALRYGLQITDSLRHAHEEGSSHGALAPGHVLITATGVEFLPAQPGASAALTPYTAPERLAGHPVDVRSDIFSVGALLYEMFTGRPAFSGNTPEELAVSLQRQTPEPIGDSALDRLVLNCLVKDPAGRCQRVQQVHMEIKILAFSLKRTQAAAKPGQSEQALQAELRQMENRLNSRMDEQYGEALAALRNLSAQLPAFESQAASRIEQRNVETVAALRQIASELPVLESRLTARTEQQESALSGVQEVIAQLPQLESRLASRMDHQETTLAGVQEVIAQLPHLESRLSSRFEAQEAALVGMQQVAGELPHLQAGMASQMEQHAAIVAVMQQASAEQRTALETISHSVSDVQSQVASLETKLAAASRSAQQAEEATARGIADSADLQATLAVEIHTLGTTVKSHAAAIESIRASLTRTDDFMERVVEALESLQTMVLEQVRDRAMA